MSIIQKKQNEDFLLPSVIFGTSALGNLFVRLGDDEKLNIIRECFLASNGKVIFDTAGKYGAGLALETLGRYLKHLNIKPTDVIISNKLGWVRTELKTEEPTFEPGVWKNLNNDAVQKISFDGIMECFEQGNELLNGYIPEMVSVHDPDEYLVKANDNQEAKKLYNDILEAYGALNELKRKGRVKSVGIGAKNWKVIKRISEDVDLDWVMIANSLTIYTHPEDLLLFIEHLRSKNISVINSAVFNSGFLVGSNFYNYKAVTINTNPELFKWRNEFFNVCRMFSIKPAEACVQFAVNIPGVNSIALNTTHANRVRENIDMVNHKIPITFWKEMKERNLITLDYHRLIQNIH